MICKTCDKFLPWEESDFKIGECTVRNYDNGRPLICIAECPRECGEYVIKM
jgi:hypothetical protein